MLHNDAWHEYPILISMNDMSYEHDYLYKYNDALCAMLLSDDIVGTFIKQKMHNVYPSVFNEIVEN